MESPTEDPQGAGVLEKRVLVAEVESPGAFSITNLLIGHGFEVHRAQSTGETIQTLRRAAVSFLPCHILILDENLPGEKAPLDAIRPRSGSQALKVIRFHPNRQRPGEDKQVYELSETSTYGPSLPLIVIKADWDSPRWRVCSPMNWRKRHLWRKLKFW